MWLLAAVLVLLGSTEIIAGLGDNALPPVARWAWFTTSQLSCGLAAIYSPYARFHWRAIGLASITLFYISYPLMWDKYIIIMPTEPATFPWPDIFVAMNVILPLILITIGPILPVMGGRRE